MSIGRVMDLSSCISVVVFYLSEFHTLKITPKAEWAQRLGSFRDPS